MNNIFKIFIKPDGNDSSYNSSLFEIRSLGAIGAIKFFIATNKYKKVEIVNNDKNGALFLTMLHSFMILNFFSIVTDDSFNRISYFSRIKSLFELILKSVKLKRLPQEVRELINAYPASAAKGEIDYSRVLYLKTNLSFGVKAGGSIGHISGVVNALNKPFKVKYISAEEPIMIDNDVEVIDVSLNECSFVFPYELNFLNLNSQYLKASNLEIEKSRPTVIYQRLTLFNYTGALLSNKLNIPLIVEYNGSEVWVQKNWGKGIKNSEIALDLEKYMLDTASKVITVSKVLVEELIDRGVDERKIVYYPNCIDPLVYNNDSFGNKDLVETRKQYGISDDEFVFTFIGTFGKWHGIEFLANGIKELIDNHEELVIQKNIRFMLIGDGLLSESIRTSLSKEKYSKYVTFTGVVPQEKAPFLLNASNAFLSPHIKQEQRFIGSPTKLFEYMSFEKPIIASDLEQIGEVLQSSLKFPGSSSAKDIETAKAVLFEPNNTIAFIDAIKFVVENRESCEIIGKNAKKEVMENYTWDMHVKKLWG